MAGTLLGGVIGGLGAYAGLFSSPALVCIVVLVNMAVVWVTPTPPFTRYRCAAGRVMSAEVMCSACETYEVRHVIADCEVDTSL